MKAIGQPRYSNRKADDKRTQDIKTYIRKTHDRKTTVVQVWQDGAISDLHPDGFAWLGEGLVEAARDSAEERVSSHRNIEIDKLGARKLASRDDLYK